MFLNCIEPFIPSTTLIFNFFNDTLIKLTNLYILHFFFYFWWSIWLFDYHELLQTWFQNIIIFKKILIIILYTSIMHWYLSVLFKYSFWNFFSFTCDPPGMICWLQHWKGYDLFWNLWLNQTKLEIIIIWLGKVLSNIKSINMVQDNFEGNFDTLSNKFTTFWG